MATMATPISRARQRKSITLSQPKTPKDVRQMNRSEMIEYLQKYDQDIPSDIDNVMRAALQKRVIQCMKHRQTKRNQQTQSATRSNHNIQYHQSNKSAQSAMPNTRNMRKRKAEIPMTSTRYKRAKMNNGNPSRLPITTLLSDNDEYKTESQELDHDLSTLQLNFDALNDTNTEFDIDNNYESKTNESGNIINNINKAKLLKAIKKGIPARYDILALPHCIKNLDENTSYFRSNKTQKLFENIYMGHELICIVRTDDDVYGLKYDAIEQIESAVTKWVHKYGEYSDNLHPSIIQNEQNQFEAQSHIFQYEVLGRFIGDEMIEDEFAEIYSGTFDEYRRNLYSWVFEVDIPINDNQYESYDILVDCVGKRKRSNKLFYVQDCRSNLEKEITTKEDLDKENVLFITMEINGWPGIFAISKRGINKNEILYGHFGDGYDFKKKQVERQQQSVDYFVNKISKILDE